MAQRSSAPALLLWLSRALLLVAVLTGLGAMHVLASGSGTSHGSMPVAATTSTTTTTAEAMPTQTMTTGADADVASTATVPGMAQTPVRYKVGRSPMGSHGLMDDCILFAATGIALLAALLAAAARLSRGALKVPLPHRLIAALVLERRGPPSWPQPRVALCVIRI
ncbi:hypothetical protein [Enterococcus hirae]|uniref:hypothetical protein n=1 Tax=Enterococcus hirae TaxID=1354 RepID=UPI00136A6ADB|nr:hypothetical protein [Enterococcus hirae]NAE18323.1 hypothetical protein [Enterococcus hirae]